jgi:hypothetical protein
VARWSSVMGAGAATGPTEEGGKTTEITNAVNG